MYYLNDSMISKSIVVGIPIIFTISVNKIYVSLKKKNKFFHIKQCYLLYLLLFSFFNGNHLFFDFSKNFRR